MQPLPIRLLQQQAYQKAGSKNRYCYNQKAGKKHKTKCQ